MTIYLLMVVLACIVWQYVYGNQDRISEIEFKKRKKNGCIILALACILVAALRGSTVGTDTASYIRDYKLNEMYSYEEWYDLYDLNPGYFFLSKFFFDIGCSVQVWFGFVAFLYVGSVTKLIYRFSQNIGLSYIMFVTLGFYSFSLAGLKQTVAMAIVLYSFNYLYDSKYIRLFACVGLATFFHYTSLIFAFVFIIAIMKKNKFIYLFLTVGFAIVVFNMRSIFGAAVDVLDQEHYRMYLSSDYKYSPTTFVVLAAVLLISFVYLKTYRDVDYKESVMMYSIMYLGVITQLFSFVVASAFRLAMYFSVFSVILWPNAVSTEKDSTARGYMQLGSAFAFVLYYIYINRDGGSTVPYLFYWE